MKTNTQTTDASSLAVRDEDLKSFMTGHPTNRKRRQRPQVTEPFAAITYAVARKMWDCRVSGAAWFLLIELDRLLFGPGGENPLRLTSRKLTSSGLTSWTANRKLYQLERAGLISVFRQRGRCPVITPLWKNFGGARAGIGSQKVDRNGR
jgi:hypothetical protein